MAMLHIAEPEIGEEEISNVNNAMNSGWISSKGSYIHEFEEKFSKYCGVKFGVSNSNGTASLHLALRALGIGPGDEVIVPNLTFIAVPNAVKYCGATPVFVDSTFDYWNIDPQKIEEKLSGKTKAIVVVHSYGYPCDMKPIMEIVERHNLFLIEDGAEAHGAKYNGKKIGSFGDISCFSFYGNKIITTGEGGMCLTNNEDFYNKMLILRDHGMNREIKYWHDVIGYNYRMTNIQAAIGVAQLAKIERFIEIRKKQAELYLKLFSEIEENKLVRFQKKEKWSSPVNWIFSLIIDTAKTGINRDKIIGSLYENNIESRPLFYPLSQLPPYKTKESFPISEYLSKGGISLPSAVSLKPKDIEYIVQTLSEMIKLPKGHD